MFVVKIISFMKISIIGNNLTGLILSKALVNKNINVKLFYNPKKNTKKTNRTIGIAKKNMDFIQSKLLKVPKFFFNTINEIGIFTENSKKSEILNFNNEHELFYLVKYESFLNLINKSLKKSKNFKFHKIKSYNSFKSMINNCDEKIIINCENNNFINTNFFSSNFSKDYKSEAFTFIFQHKSIKNNKAIQIFTKYGPLAFLPLSKTQTSVVFSVYKSKYKLDEKKIITLVKYYNKKYTINKFSNIEKVNLKFKSARKYFYKNILLFGDNLHQVHPLAGQGFNMTLRDLEILMTEIDKLKKLGLPLNKNILKNFENKTKSNNFLYISGINIIESFFKLDSQFKNSISNLIPKLTKKNKYVKNLFIQIADKGLRFL